MILDIIPLNGTSLRSGFENIDYIKKLRSFRIKLGSNGKDLKGVGSFFK